MQSPLFRKPEHSIAAAGAVVAQSVAVVVLIVGGGFAVRFAMRAILAALGFDCQLP